MSHYHPEIKSTSGSTNWFDIAYQSIEIARESSGIVLYPSGGLKRTIVIVVEEELNGKDSLYIMVRSNLDHFLDFTFSEGNRLQVAGVFRYGYSCGSVGRKGMCQYLLLVVCDCNVALDQCERGPCGNIYSAGI